MLECSVGFLENRKRIERWWKIHGNGDGIEEHYSVRVYEVPEFLQVCLDIGFSRCEAFGDWIGTLFKDDSEEVIFVAEMAA